jgi:Lrp/AsnC family transcriptional regulator, regulator for asnA, asnC and gidA
VAHEVDVAERRNDARLDDLDRAIIRILQEDAECTNTELARRVGGSEPTVRRRRRALVARGTIRVTVAVDPFALGYEVMALIGLHIDSRRFREAEAALAAMPELRFVGVTLGRYDFLTEAWFRSTADLLDFVTTRLHAVPGVQRGETLQIAKLVKYAYDWGSGPPESPATSDQR